MATRKIEVAIVGDASSLQRAFGRASKSGSAFGRSIGGIGRAAGVGLAAFGVAAAGASVKMLDLASDAGEVQSKLGVVFGKQLPGLTRELDTFAAATGASRYELRQQAADMGALLKPIVGNTKGAADMSAATVKLATDLGSFNNVPTADALEAIRAGLVGEAEPLRRFGVLLNEAAVTEEAYASGIAKRGAELTEAQKLQARYNLIMRQTKLAQGDAERTSGSMANQVKRLKNGLRDAATDMGKLLLPTALKLVTAWNNAFPTIARVTRQTLGAVIGWFERNGPTIRGVADGIIDGFRTVAETARRYWPMVVAAARVVVSWYRSNLQPSITAVVGYLRALWQRFGADILRIARAAFTVVATVVTTVMRNIKAVVELVLAVIRGDWGAAWAALKAIVSNTVSGMLSLLRASVSLIGAVMRAWGAIALAMVRAGFDKLRGVVGSAVSAAVGAVRGMVGAAGAAARALGLAVVNGIRRALAGLASLAGTISSRVVGAVTSAGGAIYGAAVGVGSRLISGILAALDGLAGAIKGKVESMVRSALSNLNPFSPVEHGGEIYIGKPIVDGAVTGIRKNAMQLKRVLSSTVVAAVRDAKQNLSQLAGNLASSVGEGIDAQARQDTAALGNSPEAIRLRELEAAAKAEEEARERARLTSERDTAKTEEERAAAAQALADFERNLEIERLRESLANQEAAIAESAEKRKTDLARGVADLTDSLNRGTITVQQYQQGLRDLLAASGGEWQNLGSLLGTAFAAGFQDQMQAVYAQAGLIRTGPQAPGQSGAEPEVRDPFAVQLKEWQDREKQLKAALDKVQARLKKARAAASKDGATPAEKRELADAVQDEARAEKLLAQHRANRPRRLALGGIVTSPTRALLGERGKAEAVIPLDSPKGLRALAALGIGGAGGGATVNIDKVVVRRDADIDLIAAGISRRLAMGA